MTFYQSLSKMLKESDEIQDTIEQDVKTCEEPVIESDDNSSILDRVAELKIAIQDGVSDDEKEALLKEIKEIEASICPDCTEPSEDAPVEDEHTEEVPEESNEELEECNQEEIKECEVKSSRILRVAPSTKAYMIEAQTKEGLAYIVGKNYDSKTKILDEAEIFTDKAKASNHFKTLLK